MSRRRIADRRAAKTADSKESGSCGAALLSAVHRSLFIRLQHFLPVNISEKLRGPFAEIVILGFQVRVFFRYISDIAGDIRRVGIGIYKKSLDKCGSVLLRVHPAVFAVKIGVIVIAADAIGACITGGNVQKAKGKGLTAVGLDIGDAISAAVRKGVVHDEVLFGLYPRALYRCRYSALRL